MVPGHLGLDFGRPVGDHTWVHLPCLLDGLVGAHVVYSHCRLMDVIIMLGPMPVADDAMSVLVWLEPLMYKWSVRSGRKVKTRRRCGLLCRAWQL